MSHSGFIHVEVERVVLEIPKAFLLLIDGSEHWIPKSQIADPDTYEPGDENVTVSMTDWIAKQKGIEGE